MTFKRARFQLYYDYNDYWKNYQIRVRNKSYNNDLLIGECKTEEEAKELTGLKRKLQSRPIGLSLVNFGKYASPI